MAPRPRKWRYCAPFAGDTFYKPRAVPMSSLEVNSLGRDELEAIRLCDLEELDQDKAAGKMNVSRGTVQRLLYSGRKKVADALVGAKALRVVGGDHIVHYPAERFTGMRRRWRHGRRWR